MSTAARFSIRNSMRRFLADRAGASAIEYAMIASGIAVAIAATVMGLGTNVEGLYSSVSSSLK
jgi:pilus assembly protein Flp/PilA